MNLNRELDPVPDHRTICFQRKDRAYNRGKYSKYSISKTTYYTDVEITCSLRDYFIVPYALKHYV